MKIFACTIAFLILAFAAGLTAKQAEARDYPWCLETGMGRGGGSMIDCRFTSRAQCLESKVSHADRCMRNPRRR